MNRHKKAKAGHASEPRREKDTRAAVNTPSSKTSHPFAIPGGWRIPAICLLLAAITLFVFGQTVRCAFVNFDDDIYVYANPAVTRGITWSGFLASFSFVRSDNWTPLTTLSHMLDCQIYGLNAWGHHLTNVLIHTASVILLFLVLRQMTSDLWPSAFVAAVFAIHPAHVESVAWVAERKDVLAGFFFMLTLGAYSRYIRKPGSFSGYFNVALAMVLGLMSKPVLVTVPFILLLLDFWPLNRFASTPVTSASGTSQKRSFIPWPLIVEKIPLLLLCLLACVPTVLAEQVGIQSTARFPLALRLSNAAVSCVLYIKQMFMPVRLAIFYPYPAEGFRQIEVVLAVLLLAAVSALVFGARHRRPWLLVGWLWYLVMLLPVIGLVQVGLQARADRHTYLSQIGLCLALGWTAREWSAWLGRRGLVGVACATLAALVICAWCQTGSWRDSRSLWEHTSACTAKNATTELNLGFALLQQGEADAATTHLQAALELDPEDALTHNDLGNALLQKRQIHAAMGQYQKALELQPGLAMACNNLAWVLAACPDSSLREGRRAVEWAEKADRLARGENANYLGTLAAAYAECGRYGEAIATAGRAVQLAESQHNPALATILRGHVRFYESGTPLRDPSLAIPQAVRE